MKRAALALTGILIVGCSDDTSSSSATSDATSGSETSTTAETDSSSDSNSESASDSNSGDGDGDSGDGDGDSGDGDGDSGDGDGDTNSGDGDGDPAGDPVCGDGVVEGDEACDDGNEVDSDACLNTCVAASCGDAVIHEGVELCDDGLNDGSYAGCTADCMALGPYCGDAEQNGPESCDDGINDDAYDGCAEDCAALGPYCGDAELNGPEACDDGNDDNTDACLACAVPSSCTDILALDEGASSGAYMIDPDGEGDTQPYSVYCEMTLAGGGWQLISTRYLDVDALFADNVCTSIDADCSGTIPAAQLGDEAPNLLFATIDGLHWLEMGGLLAPGDDALLDVITLDRLLGTSNTCTYPHYCGPTVDTDLAVVGSSDNWTPRFDALPSQFSRVGGLWFGNGGGSQNNHVVSFNYSPYCPPGGMHFSSAEDGNLGNVVCGEPGAIYFR